MALTLLQPRISTSFSGRPSQYGYSFDISVPSHSTSGLTAIQQLRLLEAAKHKDDGGSFWDKVRHGGGSLLSKALNVVLRPSWAVAEGTRRALEGEGFDIGDFFKGASRGIQGKRHTTFSEVFEQEGILEGHGRLRGLAGFGLDVVTDPTNLLLVAATPVTGGASLGVLGAKLGGRGLAEGLAREAATKAIRVGEKLDHAELNKLKFNLAGRTEYQPVKAYVDELDKFIVLRDQGVAPTAADYARLSIASRAAHDTYKQVVPRVLQGQLRIPFSRGKYIPLTPTSIAGIRTAPKAPSLGRIAEKGGVLGKVPGVAAGAQTLGKAFKLGFNDSLAGAKLSTKHVQESLAKRYSDTINTNLKPFTGMDAEKQFDAIAWYDEPGALAKNGTINEEALAKSGLDESQKEFVRMWHTTMEDFRLADDAFGLHYKRLENGRGYVPHLYGTKDKIAVLTRSQTAVPGFIRERINKNLTIREIRALKEELAKTGRGAKTVDDPIDLLHTHARQAAKAHSEKAYRDVVMKGFGVPYKVADEVRVGRVTRLLDKYHRQAQDLMFHADPDQVGKRLNTEKSRIGKKYAAKKRQALKDHLAKKKEVSEKQLDLEARFQAFHEVKEELGFPVAFSDVVRMSERDLRAGVAEGRISKEAAKVIRQVKMKMKKGDVSQKDLRRFWDLFMDRQLEGHKTPWGLLRANLQKSADKLEDRYAERLAKLDVQKEAEFERVQRRLDKEVEKANRDLDKVTKRLLTQERRLKKARTANVNPVVEKRGLIPIKRQGLRGSFNEPYAFEPRIADAIERVERVLSDDASMSKFEEMWGRWLAMWKSVVTVINPGYRVRNSLSDVWNMYIDGVPAWAIPTYGARAGHLMNIARKATDKAEKGQALSKREDAALRLMDDAYHDGILTGQFTGDIQTVAEIGRHGSPYRFLFKKKGPKAVPASALRAAHAFNRNAENLGRLTHYLYRRQYERMGRVDAAQHVRAAHFDYEELTPFEQRVMKNVAPFYTWTRKNIPFQIQQLVSRPGRVATFPKLVEESEYAAGGGEGDSIPDYVRDNFGFKVPFGGDQSYLIPQIGFADLAKLEHPKQFAQLLNPAFKTTAEVLTGKSIFTGADIEGTHPRNPVADPLGITSGLLSHLPGANVGPTKRQVRGQDVGGLGINPWYAYIFGQLPATNEIFLRRSDIKKAQSGFGGKASLVSYLGGLSMTDVDEETAELINQMKFEEEFERYLRGLRDEGLFPEAEDDGFSDFELQINELLKSARR